MTGGECVREQREGGGRGGARPLPDSIGNVCSTLSCADERWRRWRRAGDLQTLRLPRRNAPPAASANRNRSRVSKKKKRKDLLPHQYHDARMSMNAQPEHIQDDSQ